MRMVLSLLRLDPASLAARCCVAAGGITFGLGISLPAVHAPLALWVPSLVAGTVLSAISPWWSAYRYWRHWRSRKRRR